MVVRARTVLALWMDMAASLLSVILLGPSPEPLLNTGVELGVVVVVVPGVVLVELLVGVMPVTGVPAVGVAVGVAPVVGTVLVELALAGYTHPEAALGTEAEVMAVPEKSQLPVASPFFWK